MGSLGDELLKAGLLKKKDLKRIQHQERVKVKEEGREALENQAADRDKEREESRAKSKRRDRELEEAKQKRKDAKEQKKKLAATIQKARIQESGPRRFYFVTRSGSIPFLPVSDRLGKKLEYGDCAIVETGAGKIEDFAVVPADTARAVAAVEPDLVRFLNARSR